MDSSPASKTTDAALVAEAAPAAEPSTPTAELPKPPRVSVFAGRLHATPAPAGSKGLERAATIEPADRKRKAEDSAVEAVPGGFPEARQEDQLQPTGNLVVLQYFSFHSSYYYLFSFCFANFFITIIRNPALLSSQKRQSSKCGEIQTRGDLAIIFHSNSQGIWSTIAFNESKLNAAFRVYMLF